MNYWIGVVSRSHVQRGLAGGFAQMNHGKQAPLQAFTAIGFVRSGDVYLYDMTLEGSPGFVPWRIDVDYLPAQAASIKPLIKDLNFISNKTHWGAAFRFGQVKIDEADFLRIALAMGCDLPSV